MLNTLIIYQYNNFVYINNKSVNIVLRYNVSWISSYCQSPERDYY